MSDFPCLDDRFRFGDHVYIAPSAYVHGAVHLGSDTSIWPMAVIRGDKGQIMLGARCNVQDGAICHADPDAYLTIGDDVSIGHGAIVHGCTIGNGVLIGMGAVVLNWATVGEGSLIGARALVTEHMVVPPHSLVLGVPGKIRSLAPEQRERLLRTAASYVALKNAYLRHESV